MNGTTVRTRGRAASHALAVLLAACSSATPPAPVTTAPPVTPPATPAAPAPDVGTAPSPTTASGDAPEISRSPGVAGGVVVLWPRISPRAAGPELRATAAQIQQRLRALVERALPGRPVDVRPEPERVCPRAGCAAMTVGAVLTESRGACVVLALVSGAGQSPTRIVPWVGRVHLDRESVPFREPPEPGVHVDDFARCTSVVAQLAEHEAEIAEAIRTAAPSR